MKSKCARSENAQGPRALTVWQVRPVHGWAVMNTHPPPTQSNASVLPGWPPVASALAAVEQAAEAVDGLLRLSRAMAQAGRRVELSGLEGLVGRLCARSLDLPPQDGRRMAALLTSLLIEIDALNMALAARPPP